MREPSRRTTISAALYQSGFYGSPARQMARAIKGTWWLIWRFPKRHLKDSQDINRNKWSDVTMMELVLNAKCYIMSKPGTVHHLTNFICMMKHSGGGIMLWNLRFRQSGNVCPEVRQKMKNERSLNAFWMLYISIIRAFFNELGITWGKCYIIPVVTSRSLKGQQHCTF